MPLWTLRKVLNRKKQLTNASKKETTTWSILVTVFSWTRFSIWNFDNQWAQYNRHISNASIIKWSCDKADKFFSYRTHGQS